MHKEYFPIAAVCRRRRVVRFETPRNIEHMDFPYNGNDVNNQSLCAHHSVLAPFLYCDSNTRPRLIVMLSISDSQSVIRKLRGDNLFGVKTFMDFLNIVNDREKKVATYVATR